MARELFVSNTSGTTVRAVARVSTNKRGVGEGGNIGKWWNAVTLAWEDFDASKWASYALTMAELGATGFFEGDFPPNPPINEKAVEIYYFQLAGADLVQDDTKITGALFEFMDEWVTTKALEV